MDKTILEVNQDVTERVAKELDGESNLKDGYSIMALFELEQAVLFMPTETAQEAHLKDSTYRSFEYIVSKVYGNDETYATNYVEDTAKFADLIKRHSYQ